LSNKWETPEKKFIKRRNIKGFMHGSQIQIKQLKAADDIPLEVPNQILYVNSTPKGKEDRLNGR